MATTPETVTLQLKAKHFEGTRYTDNCDCAISKAAKDFFNTSEVSAGVHELAVRGNIKRRFTHKAYWDTHFYIDKAEAIAANFDETVIREIVLTPMQ